VVNTCGTGLTYQTLAGEILALFPTITSPSYPNAYDYPMNFAQWSALLPPNDCDVNGVAGTSTGIVLTQARAVTDTVTSYGVVVNRQEETPKPKASSTQANDEDNDDITDEMSGEAEESPSISGSSNGVETGGGTASSFHSLPTDTSSDQGSETSESGNASASGTSSSMGARWGQPGLLVWSSAAAIATLWIAVAL
jgi:hypothetical protein